MLVIGVSSELNFAGRVWGTGGWDPPEAREARDWVALGRLLGWPVTTVTLGSILLGPNPVGAGESLWVIAADPNLLTHDQTAILARQMHEAGRILVARTPKRGSPFAELAGASLSGNEVGGRELLWQGPRGDQICKLRTEFRCPAVHLADATVWATLEHVPIVSSRQVGKGLVTTTSFHPSAARDADGSLGALVKHLLVFGPAKPVAWSDFAGTLVLRMDDPGGAQNVHSRQSNYPKLTEGQWAGLARELRKRQARLSIGYVGGWVDDGDSKRGCLRVAGSAVTRRGGAVHPSPQVRYLDRGGHAPGRMSDYESEFRGIQLLRGAEAGDVELHGYTHMHPDAERWAEAVDRYDDLSWYREFGPPASTAISSRAPTEHPLALGAGLLSRWFDVEPTTLIFPGDSWTDAALEFALGLPLQLLSSYYLALRDDLRWMWSQHVVAPYLDEAAPAWLDAELPVVGYFHDSDVALWGMPWAEACLDRWLLAGATRLIDFRELSSILGITVKLTNETGLRLVVSERGGAPIPPRPFDVNVYLPGRPLPSELTVQTFKAEESLPVRSADSTMGRVSIPVNLVSH